LGVLITKLPSRPSSFCNPETRGKCTFEGVWEQGAEEKSASKRGDVENYIKRSFIVYTPHTIL
jgi:hypothetical protein